MALTVAEAAKLPIGTMLNFGTAFDYEVTGFGPAQKGNVYLVLLRSDGFKTFAEKHDLLKASIVGKVALDAPPNAEGLPESDDPFIGTATMSGYDTGDTITETSDTFVPAEPTPEPEPEPPTPPKSGKGNKKNKS